MKKILFLCFAATVAAAAAPTFAQNASAQDRDPFYCDERKLGSWFYCDPEKAQREAERRMHGDIREVPERRRLNRHLKCQQPNVCKRSHSSSTSSKLKPSSIQRLKTLSATYATNVSSSTAHRPSPTCGAGPSGKTLISIIRLNVPFRRWQSRHGSKTAAISDGGRWKH